MDFPSCILDKKFNQFMKGGHHVGLVTIDLSGLDKEGHYIILFRNNVSIIFIQGLFL